MRVERLDLHAYGHFRDVSLELSSPSPGLVVVLGPNEAGKSTAMRALDALLFGIPRASSDHFGHGRASLRVGGRITSASGGVLEAVRQGLSSSPLVDATGVPLREAAMAQMLGEADHRLFSTLFRVDHDDLANGSAALLETDGEIGRLVFGASLGSVALTSLLRQLDTRAARLFRAGAKSSEAHASLLSYRRLAKEAREKRVRCKTWSDLDGRLATVEASIATLRERQRELAAESSRLQRIKASLPLLTERSRLTSELHAIEEGGLVQTSEWANRVQHLLGMLSSAETSLRSAEEQWGTVVTKLDDVEVENELLAGAERIGELVEGAGRYRKDRKDVPKLDELLSGHRREIDVLLSRLGARPGTDPDTLTGLSDAERDAIERLAQRRDGIDIETARATAELSELDRAIASAEQQLGALDVPPDTATISLATEIAKSLGPIEAQLVKRNAELRRIEENLGELLGRLGLGELTPEAFSVLAVPARTRVLRERTVRSELRGTRSDLEARIAAYEEERGELLRERALLVRDAELPDRAALDASRGHRDHGWRLVRSSLEGSLPFDGLAAWAIDEALPDAYERAVAAADAVADRRYEHAAKLATLERIAIRLDLVGARMAECDAERAILEGRAAALGLAWTQEWSHLGGLGVDPDDALEWLEERGRGLELLEARRSVATEIDELSAQIASHTELLCDALTSFGVAPGGRALALLIRQADDIVTEAERRHEIRERAEHDLAKLRGQRPARVGDLERARDALCAWTRAWSDAVAPLGLGESADPAGAVTSARLTFELRKELADERRDGGRLRGLLDDIASYEDTAHATIDELAPELGGRNVTDAVAELNDRLTNAIENRARHGELVRQLDALAEARAAARIARDEAARDIGRLCASAPLATPADLSAAVERSTSAAALHDRITALEETLVAQGDGRPVEAIEREASEHAKDGDLVAAELVRIGEEQRDVDLQLDEMLTSRGQMHELLRRIDGSRDAADLDQEAEEALARTAELLEEYTKLALASALVKGVVSAYGEQHQRPILNDAAASLNSITLGAFVGLHVDGDAGKQVLLAERRNGELLRAGELSAGTRDQLYLALRLAGVRHHLDRVDEPLPLILDDLLVNCDDERCAATLEVLAGLGARTQVLMFTHDRGLADRALKTLGAGRCAVEVMTPRDHGARRAGDREVPKFHLRA